MSRFDWDVTKAGINLRRHGISFEEAEDVLADPLTMEESDIEHSRSEDRLRITGWSPLGRVVVVIVSMSGPRPRIISARRATKRERHAFEDRP
jgi:uncharacterized protein